MTPPNLFKKHWQEKRDKTGLSASDHAAIEKAITVEKQDNPWAICTAQVGRDSPKFEDCVMAVKEKLGIHKAQYSTWLVVIDVEQYLYGSKTETSHTEVRRLNDAPSKNDAIDAAKRYILNDYIGVKSMKILSAERYSMKTSKEKAVDTSFAGPTPKSKLAEQDLEGKTTTKQQESTISYWVNVIKVGATIENKMNLTLDETLKYLKYCKEQFADCTIKIGNTKNGKILEIPARTAKSFKEHWKQKSHLQEKLHDFIQDEHEGAEAYRAAAAETSDSEVKETLESMASDESEHAKKLEDLKETSSK